MTKKVVRTLIVIFLLMVWIIRAFHEQQDLVEVPEQPSEVCDELEVIDTLSRSLQHQRSWLEYTWNQDFCTVYSTGDDFVMKASLHRRSFKVANWQNDDDFWREVYKMLYFHDKDELSVLQDSLRSIGDASQMDRDEFARMVVAFVQDIPYNYVMPKGCEGFDQHPCVANERYGIFSPVEFLHRLQGDCDTRTVLLFTLLTNFGYQPIIINSNEYGHSMLALDISTSGDYLIHKGKRYAFWETTNTGWLPGMIPPDMSNKNYWNVVLDTEML
ncbi:MAG: hypothetical protein ACOYW3_06375 [Bacteroidota bacterium]